MKVRLVLSDASTVAALFDAEIPEEWEGRIVR